LFEQHGCTVWNANIVVGQHQHVLIIPAFRTCAYNCGVW
jgi:hypothetical protein